MRNFLTMGDTNYFPSIALSGMQSKKLYPNSTFVVYDWGLKAGEKHFLKNLIGVKILDWQEKFIEKPIPSIPSIPRQIHSVLKGASGLNVKTNLCKQIIREAIVNGPRGREWKFAQKPYILQDWSNQDDSDGFLFLDGDAFLINHIDEIWSGDFDIGVTVRRQPEIDFTIGHCQVINSGVIAIKGAKVSRAAVLKSWIDNMQLNFEYLIEQSALTRMIFKNDCDIDYDSIVCFETMSGMKRAKILKCENYNYNLIEEGVNAEIHKIIHFKGGRHSGERFRDLAISIGFGKELDIIEKVHGT